MIRTEQKCSLAIPHTKSHELDHMCSSALGANFLDVTCQRGFGHHHDQQINTCQRAETHEHKHACTFKKKWLISGRRKKKVTGAPRLQTCKRCGNFRLVWGLFCCLSQVWKCCNWATTAACRQTSLAARLFYHGAVLLCVQNVVWHCPARLKKKSSHLPEMLLPNLFYHSALMAPSQACRLPMMPRGSIPLAHSQHWLWKWSGHFWIQLWSRHSNFHRLRVKGVASPLPNVRLQPQSSKNNRSLDK